MPSVFAPHRGHFTVTALVALAVGCSAAGDGADPLGQSAAALSAADQTAFDYFVGKGLTSFQAAGIVGNLDQESNMIPTAVQAGGPGRGIAQWSVGGRWDTDSGDNVLAYASSHGESSTSLELQLEFIWYELTTFSGYGLASLRATTNVTDATIVFETDFEGCGECDQSNRISYAEAALAAYGSAEYAAQFVSQSFPLATSTLSMEEGQIIPSYIELKNVGTKAWDSNTRIGTTQPRDRASVFADSSWLSSSRLAGVTGTVPPGGTYKFTFNLAAPSTPGTHDEFFGVVEDGDAWFSDSGQGGPPDDDLEVKIQVVASSEPSDAGATDDASAEKDSGAEHDAGHAAAPEGGADGGRDGGAAEATDGGFAMSTPGQPGCTLGAARAAAPPWGAGVCVALAIGLRSRRRSRGAKIDHTARR